MELFVPSEADHQVAFKDHMIRHRNVDLKLSEGLKLHTSHCGRIFNIPYRIRLATLPLNNTILIILRVFVLKV